MFTGNTKEAPLFRRLAAAVAAFALLFCLTPDPVGALYVMQDSARVQVDEAGEGELLAEGSARLVSQEESAGLILPAGVSVTVTHQGQEQNAVAREESVDGLLDRLGVRPSPLDMISVSYLDGAVEIQVDSELIFYEHTSQARPHETVYRNSSSLYAGQEKVVQEGRDGEYAEVYEVIYQDGRETARQLISVTDTPAVPTIIEKGTRAYAVSRSDSVASIQTNADGSGTLTLTNGQTVSFSKTKKMTGTAYTTIAGKTGTITATGTRVRPGVVAVDRRVIPLGTKMYIVSNDGRYVYGFATAEDTGVRGNIIDLFMNTYNDCVQFGRRGCTVYILN